LTLLATSVPTLAWDSALGRLALAAALGAAIGTERELREREAGLRTHLLVAVGAALFTIVSAFGFHDVLSTGDPRVLVRLDPSRIAAQIVSGIGFLGAGAIIRQGLSVRGLTTAATLWVSAAIGMAAGAGYYSGAVITTVVVVFALWPLRWLAYHALERFRPAENRIVVELAQGRSVKQLLDFVHDVRQVEVEDERDRRVVTLELAGGVDEALVSRLADLDDVFAVRWRR
jgi:putative Mg2+ transporter-C (MgtC) family protein